MTILTKWKILSKLPAGRWFFGRLLGFFVPYTGTIGANVVSLRPGHCKALLPDRRAVRNHLGSIHALALGNLGEMTLGLAMTALQPKDGRFIPIRLEMEYVKKARGTLTCEVDLPYVDWPENSEWQGEALIKDESGDVVCKVLAHFKVGRK
ncbi:MAG: hotdog fold domain-containing protein [Vulcanimicrobiota bacterium]